MSNNVFFDDLKPLPRKSLMEKVKPAFKNKPIAQLLCSRMPIHKFYYSYEDYELDLLDYKTREAYYIFISLRNFIMENISKDEQDDICIETAYGTIGSIANGSSKFEKNTFNNILKNNSFSINTRIGRIVFKFIDRSKHEISEKTIAIYDSNTDEILIPFRYNVVKEYDLIMLLKNRDKFILEILKYIDNKNLIQFNDNSQNTKEEVKKYINDTYEMELISKVIIYTFGYYLFKNQNRITNRYDLTDDEERYILFNIFLNDVSNSNVVNAKDLENFRLYINNWNLNNKAKFYQALDQIITHTQDVNKYCELKRRVNLLNLLTIEKSLINITSLEKVTEMSNEYKDWMIDRNNDLEWCLAKAIIALQAYADTDTEEYKVLSTGKIAKNAINEIDEYLDLSTIFEKWDKKKYKENK